MKTIRVKIGGETRTVDVEPWLYKEHGRVARATVYLPEGCFNVERRNPQSTVFRVVRRAR